MRKNSSTNIILIIVLMIGLSLLLYPSISDYWNSLRQSYAITNYAEQVADMDKEKYEHLWTNAQTYNQSLLERSNGFLLTEDQKMLYDQQLNLLGTGIMGYVEIPNINCSLPVYHGTDDAVLQSAVGHLEWSSLPIGGESTHCVLSGHRGLPSAKLFTDLDQVEEGDLFMLYILNEMLTYQVDQILIVEPHEVDSLLIEEGKDLCTLVTCTPYAINSHRLLVRGHRIANEEGKQVVRVTSDGIQIDPQIVAVILAVPILILLVILLFLNDRRNQKILIKNSSGYTHTSNKWL